MTINQALQKIEKAGFTLAVDGPDLVINPPGKLSQVQRQYIKDHKAEIMSALLEASPSGNDHPPANDERALIHVPDFAATDGRRYSFDMTVPKANLERLRQVVKFKLIDNQGGGSILGAPGTGREELAGMLVQKYGERLESIDDIRHGAIEREAAPYYERDPKAKRLHQEILAKQASGEPIDDEDRLFMSAVELCRQEYMSRHGGQVIEGESREVRANCWNLDFP